MDALKHVCSSLNTIQEEKDGMSYLIITHYERMLNYVEPDTVCIMKDGDIVEQGGPDVASTLEDKGYEAFGGEE